jgi:acyl carrier protein
MSAVIASARGTRPPARPLPAEPNRISAFRKGPAGGDGGLPPVSHADLVSRIIAPSRSVPEDQSPVGRWDADLLVATVRGLLRDRATHPSSAGPGHTDAEVLVAEAGWLSNRILAPDTVILLPPTAGGSAAATAVFAAILSGATVYVARTEDLQDAIAEASAWRPGAELVLWAVPVSGLRRLRPAPDALGRVSAVVVDDGLPDDLDAAWCAVCLGPSVVIAHVQRQSAAVALGAGQASSARDRSGVLPLQTRYAADPEDDFVVGLRRDGGYARVSATGEIVVVAGPGQLVDDDGVELNLLTLERRLRAHPGVGDAWATATPAGRRQQISVAYAVSEGRELPAPVSREWLTPVLPVAPVMVELLARSGRDPETGEPPADPADPAGPVGTSDREGISTIFADVLRLSDVDPRTSFFDLGGTSLGAMILLSRIEDELNLSVSLQALYADPTVDGLASAAECIA